MYLKNIFTILIVASFFFCQVAYYFVYAIVRYSEQEKIEAHLLSTIPESDCEIINFTLQQNKIYCEEEGKI